MATPERIEQLRRLAEIQARTSTSGRQRRRNQAQEKSLIEEMEAPYSVTDDMTTSQKYLAGIGKSLSDLGTGFVQAMESVPHPELSDSGTQDYLNELEGLKQTRKAEIDETKKRDQALMETGAGMAGNLTGNVAAFAPTALIPGANTMTGGALIGSTIGALTPRGEDDSLASNVITGTIGGTAGAGLSKALGRVLNPQTSTAARELLDADVPLTPGQILGPTFRRFEEGSKSIPFIGQGIRDAEVQANKGFNNMVLNKILKPIGKNVKGSGRDSLSNTRRLVSESYDDALSNLKRVDIDRDFAQGIETVREMATTLPDAKQVQLDKILNTELYQKLTPAGSVSGESFKNISSALGAKARGYAKSPDFDQRQLGDALNAINQELRKLASRTNPVAAKAIEKSDAAYAMLLRAENAAGRAGAVEGRFTPAHLQQATKQLDSSLRKIDSTQGKALLQDVADSGRNVLGSTVPDSGTPERLAGLAMLGGGYMFDPMIAGGMLAGRGAYTPPVRKALEVALARRPEFVRSAGRGVSRLSPYAAALAADAGGAE